jgi:hypothetical protein
LTDACLRGTWAVADYEAFLQAALDLAGASAGAMPITFEGASGDLALTFDATTITYAATGFELRGSATTPDGITVSVAVRLNGQATSGYEVTGPGTIELIEPDPTGLVVEAEVFIAGTSAGVTPMGSVRLDLLPQPDLRLYLHPGHPGPDDPAAGRARRVVP